MRSVALVVIALATLRAPVARAGAILYATAATENRVDGFCLNGDGSLAPTPTVQVGTAGVQPRKLVVATNGSWTTLYVVEVDRVEAFSIGPHGFLKLIGATPVVAGPNANSMDVAFSPDMSKVYVAEQGRDRIAAYPLDPTTGAPMPPFTSCIKGPKAPQWQRLAVANGFLYVTSKSLSGRISVFPIAADGSLPEDPSTCTGKPAKTCNGGTRDAMSCTTDNMNAVTGCPGATCPSCCLPPPPTCPCSERRRLDDPKAILVDGDTVFVESLLKKRIIQFTLGPTTTDQSGGKNTQKGCPALADHQFAPPHRKKTPTVSEPVCLKDESTGDALAGNFRWQSWTSATNIDLGYQDVVRAGDTLLASQFVKARVDAFHLKDDGRLPKSPTVSTKADVRGSPVGLAVRKSVLYVAAGEFDLVQAFGLGPNLSLPDPTPFSETDVLTNSFPNAVATADLSDDCR
jgi:6-phosphogluconolactonase (cycloisomerase 2 family)